MKKSRVVLVTGASRGLGAAIADRLARDGHQVAVNYCHSPDKAEKVVAAIAKAGGTAHAFRADVTREDEAERLVTDIEDRFGRVEILVNNATGPQPERPLEEYVWKDFEDQIDFFIKAPVLLVQAVLGAMKRARWGKIINIGSEVADNCRTNFSPYVAAKCAMAGLSRAWALEFAPWNIAVNLIAPGWIPTERHDDVNPVDLEAYRGKVPMGRQGLPEDVAGAVSFFAAEETNFVSGQRLAVNGANTF